MEWITAVKCTQVNARAVTKNRVHALKHVAAGIRFMHFAKNADIPVCGQAVNDHS